MTGCIGTKHLTFSGNSLFVLAFLSAETRITGTLAISLGLLLRFNFFNVSVPFGIAIGLLVFEIVFVILAATFFIGDIADMMD